MSQTEVSEGMLKEELLEVAADEQVEVSDNMTKAEIVEAIEGARQKSAQSSSPVDAGTLADMRRRINELEEMNARLLAPPGPAETPKDAQGIARFLTDHLEEAPNPDRIDLSTLVECVRNLADAVAGTTRGGKEDEEAAA